MKEYFIVVNIIGLANRSLVTDNRSATNQNLFTDIERGLCIVMNKLMMVMMMMMMMMAEGKSDSANDCVSGGKVCYPRLPSFLIASHACAVPVEGQSDGAIQCCCCHCI